MATILLRSVSQGFSAYQQGVLTIGNFDGVHLGHQQLLKQLVAEAHQRSAPSIVMTFEPHPFEFFAAAVVTIPRLTRLREKFYAIAALGVDYLIVLPFNQSLAMMTAEAFINNIIQSLGPQHLLLGDDFHFGYQRKGNLALLKKAGEKRGFSVETMPTFKMDGERVSSTRIRTALQQGQCDLAARLLGRPYSMMGRIRGGDRLGRQLGFPTANIYLHRKLTPLHGIFTVYMHGIAEHALPGVANIGTRPTVDGTRTLLEVHLLDFTQEIYGRYVEVEFCEKLRDEERYPNLQLLKEQIEKDVEIARNYFKKHGA